MSILHINTGTSANKGDGDSIRLAFHKVNLNFSEVVRLTEINTFTSLTVTTTGTFNDITATNITVLNTATINNLTVGGTFNVGQLQGFDDFNIIKNDASGLFFRIRNTDNESFSAIQVLDGFSGGLTIRHQNLLSASPSFESGQHYIFGNTPFNVLNIGRYANLNFYANAALYTNPLAPNVPSITIQASDGRVIVNKDINIDGDIIPQADALYDLGSPFLQWRSLYVGTSTIYLGGTALSVSGGILTVDGSPVGGNDLQDLTISGSQISSISGVVELKGSVYAQLTGALENNVFVNYAGAQINLNTGTTIWTFDTNGLLTLPSGNTTIGNFYGSDAILCSTGTAFGIVSQGAGSSVLQWLDDVNAPNVIAGIAVNSLYSNTGSVQIYTGAIGSPPQNTWTFAADGIITFPDGTTNSGDTVISTSTYDIQSIGNTLIQTSANAGAKTWTFTTFGSLTAPGHIIPTDNLSYDLGSTSSQWRSLYVGTSTIYLGGTALSIAGGNLTVDGSPVTGGVSSTLVNDSATVTLSSTGTLTLPNNQTIDASSSTILTVGSTDARLHLDSFNQVAKITAKKSFNRNFYSGGSETFTYTTGTVTVAFLDNTNLYFRELLSRLESHFDGNDNFAFDYSNVVLTINTEGENLASTVTNVTSDFADPPTFTITLETAHPEPITITDITIDYDYNNTIGLDVDSDYFGIATDNDDIDIRSGRDIDLIAADDVLIRAGSEFSLTLNQRDGQADTAGIEISTNSTASNNVWRFGFDGDLALPQDGGIVFDRADTTIRVGMGFHIASGEGISLDAIDQTAILTLTGAGNGPVNQTYNKTNDTLYTGNDNSSVTVENLGGTWFVFIDGDAKYTSNDLIGWALSTGPGPVPVGVLSNGYKSWGFSPTGNLTFPDGTTSTGATVFANSSSYKIQTIWFDGISGNAVSTYEFGADSITIPGNGVIYNAGQEGYWSLDGANQSFTFPNLSGISYGLLNAGLTVDDLKIQAINTGNVVVSANNIDWVFGTDGTIAFPDGTTSTGAIVSAAQSSSFIIQTLGSAQASPSNVLSVFEFGVDGTVTLPGGGVIDGSDYDVTISAGDDGSSTYGHVTLKTNGPNGVNEFYMNSLGELNLPRGGVIQETEVMNELWGTTTTSLTLVPAGANNGTQRLEIYSTGGGEGDHIHITSGDQNVTDLFLGNDTQYFAVGAMGQNEIRARRGDNSPSPGTSAGSGSPVWIYAGNAGDNGGSTADGAPGGDVFLQAGIASDGLGGEIILASGNGPTGHGSIKLSTNGGSSHLEFNNSGTLTFPSGGNITFDSSATSNIYGVTSIEFADGTTQTTAWLAGTVSSVETNSLTTFIPETGTFTNTNQLTVSHQAHAADYGFNFTINYQSPLDETKGVTVGAINTPLILSTSSVKVRANLSTSTEWTFGTNGVLTLPVGGDIKDSTGTSVLGTTLYLLEAYANVTYTLPGSFTEDTCRYSIVNNTVNVPSAWFNTSTYTFTPLKAGYWEITASYDVYRNTEASLAIKKNADIVAAAGAFNSVAQQVTKIVYLNGSTDYINIINVGGAALSRSQYDSRSWFQARWVGN